MNVYDFDKTIYGGDSTADFYLFSLKRHKKILLLAPSLLGAFLKFYLFRKGSKTDFKQVMYRFLRNCDIDRDVKDFWAKNRAKIKQYYGIYDGINCHGKEKVRRFYEMFPNGKIEEFYSDSYSDTPLAEIAEKAYIVTGEELTDWKFEKRN